MPTSKYYQNRKQVGKYKNRRSYGYKRKANVKQMAYSAYKMARGLKKVVNVERKVIYSSRSAHGLTTAAQIDHLTGVATGTGYQTRNGNSIRANALNWRFYVTRNGLANSYIRIIIFMDVASNGTMPTPAQLLETPDDVNSHLNVNNGKRFTVLKDYVFKCAEGESSHRIFKGGTKLNHVIEYTANTTNIADTSTGHLFILAMSDRTDNLPQLSYRVGFKFIDN